MRVFQAQIFITHFIVFWLRFAQDFLKSQTFALVTLDAYPSSLEIRSLENTVESDGHRKRQPFREHTHFP